MYLEESLQLFGISDITAENNCTIKSRYKKLMIKYHPDNCSGDDEKAKNISVAYEILKDAIESINKYNAINTSKNKYTIVLPLSKIIKLYSGDTVTIGSDSDKKVISSKDIQVYNTIVLVEASITHNNITSRVSNSQQWNISDNYSLNCDIAVDSLNKEDIVIIEICGITKRISFSSSAASIKINLGYNVTVNFSIRKKLI